MNDLKNEGQSNNPERTANIVDDEVIRSRVRRIIDEPKPDSTWKRLSTNPVITLVLGFALTGIVGAILTNHYNSRQKELEFTLSNMQRDREREKDERQKELEFERNKLEREREREQDQQQRSLEYQRSVYQKELEREKDARQKILEFQRSLSAAQLLQEKSFADELNKARIPKISEIWEQIYAYESEFKEAEELFQKEIDLKIKQLQDPSATWFERVQYKQIQIAVRAYSLRMGGGSERSMERRWIAVFFFSKRAKEIYKKSDESFNRLSSLANRNRFWLGEDNYLYITEYIAATRKVISTAAEIVDKNDTNALQSHNEKLKELETARENFRLGVLEIRKKMLREEN